MQNQLALRSETIMYVQCTLELGFKPRFFNVLRSEHKLVRNNLKICIVLFGINKIRKIIHKNLHLISLLIHQSCRDCSSQQGTAIAILRIPGAMPIYRDRIALLFPPEFLLADPELNGQYWIMAATALACACYYSDGMAWRCAHQHWGPLFVLQ